MVRILVGCFLFFMSATIYAADFETIIVASSEPVPAGERLEIEIVFINSGDRTIQAEVKGPLHCRLISIQGTFEEILVPLFTRSQPAIVIPANGFLKKAYSFIVPESLEGYVSIELVQFSSNRVLFYAQKIDDEPEMADSEIPASTDTFEQIQTLFQADFPYLPAYEPTYFDVGIDPENSKFQFSFKYRLFGPKYAWAKTHPWLTGFHFGYTQTSLWDLQAESKPFEDTSYKPELFYLSQNINLDVSWLSFFCIQTGLQHESNGKGGTDSRSTNHLYVRPIFAFIMGDDYHLKVAPKAWLYVNNDNDTNSDLEDYRGYFDFSLKFGKQNGLVLGSNLRHGSEGGSMQVDLTCPLYKILFLDENQTLLSPNLYLHTQYFNGYAESLLNYNKKDHALRLGIAFVR